MDIQAEKLELIQAILDIEDVKLVRKLRRLIAKYSVDWFDELTEDQQQSIDIGLAQADRGEFISREEVIAKLGL